MPPSESLSLLHNNSSAYTLNTVHSTDSDRQSHRDSESLLRRPPNNYGTATVSTSPPLPSPRRLIINSTLKMASLFILSCLSLGLTLWLALPTLEEEDRPKLKIPKSFAELQALNFLLNKYRDIYPYRIFVCYVTTYLFLQAFSLPGSMYLSILGGAVWGVPRALPLACTCVATGATFCYLISAALGPALLTLPRWRTLMEKWTAKIQSQKDNVISFLIVLRIAPLPPHWVVNVICPHVGIGIVPFWISTFLGVFGVSVIHTTIGAGLDDMTSAEDFRLISWKNFFGLSAIVVGVLVPVVLRYHFRGELDTANEELGNEEQENSQGHVHGGANNDVLLVSEGRLGHGGVQVNNRVDEEDDVGSSEDDDDEDVILEAGPSLQVKGGSKGSV